jgi:hypothetical protein
MRFYPEQKHRVFAQVVGHELRAACTIKLSEFNVNSLTRSPSSKPRSTSLLEILHTDIPIARTCFFLARLKVTSPRSQTETDPTRILPVKAPASSLFAWRHKSAFGRAVQIGSTAYPPPAVLPLSRCEHQGVAFSLEVVNRIQA